MRGAEHGAQQAQRARHASVREVTTNEIGAAESSEDTALRAAEGFSPPAAAVPPQPTYSRIGKAEHERRMDAIARHRSAGGHFWKVIGAELGMSPDRIRRWWEVQEAKRLGVHVAERRPRVHWQPNTDVQLRPGQTRRLCMTCSKPFASDGPHNRLCPTHRLYSDASPYAPEPGGSSGRQVWARRS